MTEPEPKPMPERDDKLYDGDADPVLPDHDEPVDVVPDSHLPERAS
jgi:hypothetical protein